MLCIFGLSLLILIWRDDRYLGRPPMHLQLYEYQFFYTSVLLVRSACDSSIVSIG